MIKDVLPFHLLEETLEPITDAQFSASDTIENKISVDANLIGLDTPSLKIEHSLLRRVQMSSSTLKKLQLAEVVFDDCDLSNSSWLQGSIGKVVFRKCRLTGLQLNEALLEDVTFSDCLLDLSQLRFAKLKNVKFERCVLREADFQNSTLPKTIFIHCNLEKAQFLSVKMAGADFRGSQIDSLIVTMNDLKGVIMSSEQLMSITYSLAQVLGIQVVDD